MKIAFFIDIMLLEAKFLNLVLHIQVNDVKDKREKRCMKQTYEKVNKFIWKVISETTSKSKEAKIKKKFSTFYARTGEKCWKGTI